MAKKLSQDQIEEVKLLEVQLNKAYQEMTEFAKKTPKEKVSVPKLRLINRILARIIDVLKEDPSVAFLEKLDEDEVPSISDAVMIMGQHSSALFQFKKKAPALTWL
jgi:hypothetical protein